MAQNVPLKRGEAEGMNEVAFLAFWILVGFILGTFAHEAGHWTFARLTYIPVTRVRIGVGRTIMRGCLGKTELELRAWPIGGYVGIDINRKTARLRIALFVLGGVAANAALLGLTAWLWHAGALASFPEAAVAGFAIAQFVLLGSNLTPTWSRLNGIRVPNDGLQIVQLVRGRHCVEAMTTYDDLLASCAGDRQPRMTDASQTLRDWWGPSELWGSAVVRRQMLDAVLGELSKHRMAPEERSLALGFLVTVALISRDPIFYPYLEGWASQVAVLEQDGTMTNTRGVVLVELGQFAAGKALLDAVAKPGFATKDSVDMSERIFTQAFIARAEGGLGDPGAGRRRLVQARCAVSTNAAFEVLRLVVDRIDRELIAGSYRCPDGSRVMDADQEALPDSV